MNTIIVIITVVIFASLLIIVGLLYLIFNIVLKKTNFRIKTELEQDSYNKLSDKQKLKYILSIIFCGVSLGVFLFLVIPQ
ncbi:MAG: hypothetical protein KBB62_01945 [Candidatus Pacebacteria bacterium]|nr:hypothetical protein [Candidatus Paceibacterota bacterium]